MAHRRSARHWRRIHRIDGLRKAGATIAGETVKRHPNLFSKEMYQ